MDLVSVLQNAQNPNLQIRSEAEAHLNQAIEAQYGPFLLALVAELATEGKPQNTRQLAGLYIKNLITAKDRHVIEEKEKKWLQCDPSLKDQIRSGFLQAILSPVTVVSHTAAQILAAYGAVDVENGSWPTLLPALLNNISNPEIAVQSKVSSLEALGYMCDAMDPDKLEAPIIAQILSAIIDGMRSDRPNEVRLAGVVALNNSLSFTSDIFNRDNERDMIMRTVCESTLCTDMGVREKAFECLAHISDLYFHLLQPYMDTIFQLTTAAIRTDDHKVGMQAIEFWSTVCDCETSVLDDIREGVENAPVYMKLIEQAAPTLVPIMLETLTKQQEDTDGDETWSIAMAGATCLEAMARTIEDAIVPLILPFVTQNITSTNWQMKEAAIMAFGSIVEGPTEQKLLPIVGQAMPVLIGCLSDPTAMVRDTTAWTIGKVCLYHKSAVTQEMLQPMLEGLSIALTDVSPRVAAKACFAIHSLAEACVTKKDAETNVLSQFMPFLLEKLLAVTNREDWDSENLRRDAYEAVNMIVTNSAKDMQPVVVHVLSEALNRLEGTFGSSCQDGERMDLQSSTCSLIGVCAQKLTMEEMLPLTDRIMQLLLQVFAARGAIAHEDAFMAIGYMATTLGETLIRYMPYLQPVLIAGLKNVAEYQVCAVCVGVVSDACRSLNSEMAPYCDEIMRCLLELLQSSTINRSVKPHVIALFGDIAIAISGDFERYTSIVFGILQQAGLVNIEEDDEDLIDYVNSLRVAILEAYTGILTGLKESNRQNVAVSAIDTIVELLQRSSCDEQKSEEVLKAAVGLLGDLGMTFGSRMAPIYHMPFVKTVFEEGVEAEDSNVKWAQGIAHNIITGKTV